MFLKIIILSAIALGNFAYAKTELSVVIENNDNYPYSNVSYDLKEITGLHIDMISAVAKKLGLKIRWVVLPWNRAIRVIERGEADAIAYVTPSKERNAYMFFLPGNVLHEDTICVVTRKDFKERKFNGTIQSLYGEKVGMATNYVISQNIFDNRNKFDLYEQTVVGDQVFSMLIAGRFNYSFGTPRGLKKLKSRPEFANLVPLKPCLAGDKRFIAFSKKVSGYEDQASKFSTVLKSWKKTAEYKKLLVKYDL